jgi:hypothetical protein
MVYDNYQGKSDSASQKEYDDYSVGVFARLEIPIRDRFNLRKYADILRDLADELDRLSRDTETKDVFLAIRTQSEIQYANKGIQRLARRGKVPK